ncbi:MAG: NAD-dependent deacetylase [Ilumatobacter coccineus]|uniref:protein acetyllysine N-acetyltransferase n=1 Tax=Ilumatobacter coccineus TaxID=467094 RepID=A0A2G6KA22_9ACTN|nr:MAG: NAD-dependent deacetylase [Ilumatobacter coccineus]
MAPPTIDVAAEVIGSATRLVVLTGAGISTDSGIPDFRGPNGVWTRNPAAEKASNIHYYLTDPEVRRAAWLQRLDTTVWTAEPNLGHHCIVDLQRSGRLAAVITQNIDGLHQESGIDPDLVIEVHGTMRDTRCLDCGDVRSMREALDRVRSGEADPPCRRCGGIMKADTISFGQALIPEVIDRAFQMAQTCDVLLNEPRWMPGLTILCEAQSPRFSRSWSVVAHGDRSPHGAGNVHRWPISATRLSFLGHLLARSPPRPPATSSPMERSFSMSENPTNTRLLLFPARS